jgi:hypothetical protein
LLTSRSIAVGSLVLAFAGPAAAQVDQVEAQFERGVTLREAGRDAEALEVFRQLWEATHGSRARAQVAMAEHALGRWVEALVHLREALAAPDAWVLRNRAALRGLLATIERHFGALTVLGSPAGAAVRVDGSPVGVLPMAEPVRVASGRVRVEVSAPGYAPVVRAVVVGAGGVTRETVRLTPLGLAPGPARGASGLRTGAWVVGAAGLALLAGAGVTFALHEATVDRYNGRCLGRLAPPEAETSACRDDRDAEATLRAVSTAGLVAGAAAGVLSVVLVLAAPSRGAPGQARVACGGGPGDVGVACGGRF